ncbi:CheY-like receiver, AAA-type ATPase, and DNA-binding domain containing response regulator [Desulfocurvibacter africanus PCS]|uniref:CheY-like receiver, AAA-type ATPase, and DNA-binding domain containing response regulator n=1 Tax=Desulfocurvibacter africanus PCS TaxID=1262666 RepID=M5PTP0_DESAF|nr:sigma-54 dependent transcriptional regulator [Desulfocurvibacter africanus]EMG37717.1 CheY-like receiver, AAA-type ATPase, and DNA-binding domain containing response regulator [Desulfocurvibacter africanus PCS]
MGASILIVDDEQAFLNSVTRKLRLEGFDDLAATPDPTAVAGLLAEKRFDAAILDITMPGMDGLEVLELIKRESPRTECIMVTANESIPMVIQAIKQGAFDYLVKPLQPDQLVHALKRALERGAMLDLLRLRQEAVRGPENSEAFAELTTANESMLRVLREAELHARSDIAVLLTGETGTGKELLARAIHKASPRKTGPFIAVNMLALSTGLFESEFFGHAKGAFTGAMTDTAGYLAQARGGTLFLDEIGDLPLELQGKLLRILQEHEFTPVGKTRPEKADVRFVAATNCDLDAFVSQSRFRKDLYYRLRFAALHLPPLRERKDDIRALTEAFIQGSAHPQVTLSEQAMRRLLAHDWPGNVRELRGVIESAANLAEDGQIQPEQLHLPEPAPGLSQALENGGLEPLAEVERRHILAVYEALERNKTQAARVLGIGLATLQRKLKGYGVK